MDIEILEYNNGGYSGVMEFESWKVAFLNSDKDWEKENVSYWQKHSLTDEVFVLLEGKCVLYSATDGEKPENFSAVNMEKNKVYNVKKGVWHTHALAQNTKVLIVENADTTMENSPVIYFEADDKEFVINNF